LAERFKELFDLDSNDHFYLFLSRVTSWELEPTDPGADDNNPPFNVDSVNSEIEVWQQAFGFKRIGFNDVFLVVPRINWEPGRAFDQYDDDVDLFNDDDPKKFYVLVDGRDVYKCLGNNFGGLSTEKPTGTSTEAFVRPNDLYRWKFLYRVPEDLRDFLTEDFMPVEFISGEGLLPDERQLQFNVQEAAIDGSIDFVDLISPGDIDPPAYPFSVPANAVHFVQRSENSIEDTGPIASFPVLGDVELDNGTASVVNGAYNNMVLRIIDGAGVDEERIIVSYDGPNQTATLNAPFSTNVLVGDNYEVKSREMKGASILSQVNDVFNGYVVTIVSGPGIGQQRDIVGYDGVTQIFTLNTAWEADLIADANPALSSFYTITPKVIIVGDGQDATATSIVNSESVITQINVVDRGFGYTRAEIQISPLFPLGSPIPAVAEAEISPAGGHGSNAVKELCAHRALVVVRTDQDELGVFQVANDFRQFGIVRNPVLNDGSGTVAGEEIEPQLRIEVAKNINPLLTGSFTVGRFVLGDESGAVGEIIEWTPDGTGDAGVLIVKNPTSQDFVLPEGINPGELLHQFDSTPAFTDLDVATVVLTEQLPRNTPESYRQSCQITLQSDGTITNQLDDDSFTLDRIAQGQSSLRLTDASNYVSGEDFVAGELVTGQSSGVTATVVSWTPAAVGFPGSVLSLSTVVGTFLDGEIVLGGISGFEIVIDIGGQVEATVQGIIVQWEPAVDGLTGVLSLVDVRGSFEIGEQIDEFDPVAETTVTDIGEVIAKTDPELEHRSGELLYIQNVKPIQRDIEQAEEFKILIEF